MIVGDMQLVLGKELCLSRGIRQMTYRGPCQPETDCSSEEREFQADEVPQGRCTVTPEYSCSIQKPFALEYNHSQVLVSIVGGAS